MKECITPSPSHFTKASSLAALGVKLRHIQLFEPIQQLVHIGQKTVKYSPLDKLYDSFITMLAGAYRMVEINTHLRADPARPRRLWSDSLCRAIGGATDSR